MRVRPRHPVDHDVVRAFLERHGTDVVARRGELLHPLEHPGLVAEDRARLLGVLTYAVNGDDC